MKINGNEIRPGYVLEHNDRIWLVARAETLRRPVVAAVVEAIHDRMADQYEVLLGIR